MEDISSGKPHRVSHYTLACLVQQAYLEGGGIPPKNWEIHDAAYPNGNKGLGVATYINHEIRSIVIAIRGTDFSKKDDVLTDFRLALGGIPNGTLTTSKLAEKAKKLADSEGTRSRIPLSASIVASLHQDSFIWKVFLKLLLPILKILWPNKYEEIISIFGIDVDSVYSQGTQLTVSQREPIANALVALEEELPRYEIIISGHSLGGSIAELTASISNLPAVTFESPGSKPLLAEQHNYREDFVKQNFTYYLAAPNLVNTLYEHIGKGYRLYITHAESSSWKFLGRSTLGTAKKILAVSTLFGSGPIGGAAVAAFATDQAAQLFADYDYLYKQHILENSIACFDSTTGKPKLDKVGDIISWPCRGVSGIVKNKLKDVAKSMIPFRSDQANLYSAARYGENTVIENQIENMDNYQIYKP